MQASPAKAGGSSRSLSAIVAIAAIGALNEELDRSPHSITSNFFLRTTKQDSDDEVRQRVSIGAVVSAHLFVVALWCRQDLKSHLTAQIQDSKAAWIGRIVDLIILALWLSSCFIAWADIALGDSEPSTLGLVTYNSLGFLFCLCTVIGAVNVALWVRTKFIRSSECFSMKWSTHISLLKFIGAGCLAAAHVFFCELGPEIKRIDMPLENLPIEMDGYKIVHLTDLHIGPTRGREFINTIVQSTIRLQPDLIVITGDVMDGSADANRAASIPLSLLHRHAPTLMVTGNHDHLHGDVDNILDLMRELGIEPLRNEMRTIRSSRGSLQVAGVDDATASLWPGFGANVSRALSAADPRLPVLMLAHQPNTAKHALAEWRGRKPAGGGEGKGGMLVLSGHTHCGQMFPFQLLAWMGNSYFCGHYEEAGDHVYVSAGSGQWGPTMRLGDRSEITLHTLRRRAEQCQ